MKRKAIFVQLRQPKSRQQLQRDQRLRMTENVVNVLLGLSVSIALFLAGWLVGAGTFG